MIKYILIILIVFGFSNISMKPVKQSYSDTIGLGMRKHLSYTGKNIYFYGNSIVYGVAASDTQHRYTTLISQYLGAVEKNFGVSGQTLVNNGCGNYFDYTIIPTYNSSTDVALYFDLGINDIGAAGTVGGMVTPAQYRSQLRIVLNYAISVKGWTPSHVILATPYYAFSYRAYIGGCFGNITVAATQARADSFQTVVLEEAKNFRCKSINIRQEQVNNNINISYYAADSLHPNNSGHNLIFQILKSYL